MKDLYIHKQETWDEKKCALIAKKREKNAYGDRWPYPGLIHPTGSAYVGYGATIKYNGGCFREGEHYKGETVPLPKIPDSFEFHTIPSWGIHLRKKVLTPVK